MNYGSSVDAFIGTHTSVSWAVYACEKLSNYPVSKGHNGSKVWWEYIHHTGDTVGIAIDKERHTLTIYSRTRSGVSRELRISHDKAVATSTDQYDDNLGLFRRLIHPGIGNYAWFKEDISYLPW